MGGLKEKGSLLERTTIENLFAVACLKLCSAVIPSQRVCKDIDACLLEGGISKSSPLVSSV